MNQQSAKNSYTGAKLMPLLIKKSKIIICVSLIVAVLAAATALALGLMNTPYGNTVSFYLSREDASDKLLPFLTSEVFTERLLLDEYGLPADFANDPKYKDAYDEAKQAVIAYNEARQEWREVSKQLSRINLSLTTPKDPVTGETLSSMEEIDARYNNLKSTYTGLYELLAIYMAVNAEEMVTEEHKLQIRLVEAQLVKAQQERDAFKESAYNPAILEKQKLIDQYNLCSNNVKDTRKEAEDLTEALLEVWRNDDEVKEQVALITSALSFSYEIPGDEDSIVQKEEENKNDSEETKELYSFLKVYVSLEGDSEFASFIINRLKAVLPEYAMQSIENFDSADTVDCTVTSPFSEATALELNQVITSTALVAIVAFVVTAAIICFIIWGKAWVSVIKTEDTKSTEKENS